MFVDHGFGRSQPRRGDNVNDPMRLSIIQIIAALAAAVCVVIAFIATGIGLIFTVFMLLAVAALGFIAWTAIRRAVGQPRP
jgi:hypothetical protein